MLNRCITLFPCLFVTVTGAPKDFNICIHIVHRQTSARTHTRTVLPRSWTAATHILVSGWGCCGLPVPLQSFVGVYRGAR